MATIKDKITIYITKQEQINNLFLSNRLDAKTQSSNLSIELSELHSEITAMVTSSILYYENVTDNNRSVVAQLIGHCKMLKDIGCGYVILESYGKVILNSIPNSDGMDVDVYYEISDGAGDELQITGSSSIYGLIDYVSDENGAEKPIPVGTPLENASNLLIAIAKKLNKDIVFKYGGSYHEKFLYVGLDL